jgi:tetratricopeptide (TPR) repeat protein
MKQISGFVTCLLLLVSAGCFSRDSKTDSLLSLLKADKEDSTRMLHLNLLCNEYAKGSNVDAEMRTTNQILSLFRNKASRSAWFKKELASTNNYLGNLYLDQGDYPRALGFYLESLKGNEEVGNKEGVGNALGNLGLVYDIQGEYDKALEYDLRALGIEQELGEKDEIITSNGNIGILYAEKLDYIHSLDYLKRALKMAKESGDKHKMSNWLGNIGVVYAFQKKYDQAEEYYSEALKLAEEINDLPKIALTLQSIGSINTETRNYEKAFSCLYRALALSDSLKRINSVMDIYLLLSTLYERSTSSLSDTVGGHASNPEQMRLRSLYYYKKAISLKDTLFSAENKKQLVRKEMSYEFEKKEASTQAEHDKEIAVSEAQNRKKAIVIWLVAGGLILVIIFSGILFRSLKVTRKQKHIIELQKREVERQKELVEEHRQDIIDSITYAKRLQEAILPPLESVKKHLPESFILFKPKDIVAGDFYWMEIDHGTIFIAAADCTGHGVPGAMMSVVCSNALNRTIKEFKLRDTGKILDKVTDLVLETFEKGKMEVKDGMDISLLSINLTEKRICWSGANNPLWYISNGIFHEIGADKQPIGRHDNRKMFISHTIPYEADMLIYLFSDGYADQFGGEKGKKFMSKNLKELLSHNSHLPMQDQKTALEVTFKNWVGRLSQVDDVTLIGIRV